MSDGAQNLSRRDMMRLGATGVAAAGLANLPVLADDKGAPDKLPKGSQPKAKRMLHEIYRAESRTAAEKAFDLFVRTYEAKYPKATECLVKDRGALLTFYDFPAEHWVPIRATNPIESTFATVRLRHDKTKGSGSRQACLTMVFKLMESASRSWRSLNGSPLLAEVVKGTVFIDGVREKPAA